MQIKKTVIIDTDPGIDDAMALAIALNSPLIEVPLITTVSGNVGLEKVTHNALRLLAYFDKNIPVAKGAEGPLIRQSRDVPEIHGETGLAGFDYPHAKTECLLMEHAVNAMYRTLKQCQKTTLLAIGPLTNIALLLKMYPDSVQYIDEIVLMGGAIGRGNYGVYTEFNSGFDPEATKIVFNAPVKKVMIGLEIGDQAVFNPEMVNHLKNANAVGEMLYQLFQGYQSQGGDKGINVYDSTAIGYILKSELYTVQPAHVDVELTGQYTAGATVVDFENLPLQPTTMVCTQIASQPFLNWVVESIRQIG